MRRLDAYALHGSLGFAHDSGLIRYAPRNDDQMISASNRMSGADDAEASLALPRSPNDRKDAFSKDFFDSPRLRGGAGGIIFSV